MQGDPMSQGTLSPSLLIANHHRETNELIECMLWLRGFDAESVETLAAAEAHLRVKRAALLICRNAMPDGFGTDFIESAWKHFSTPGVIVTGTLMVQGMEARISPGALRGVLVIPFTADELFSTVQRALGT